MNLTSRRDVTNSAYPLTMTTTHHCSFPYVRKEVIYPGTKRLGRVKER